MTGPRSRNSGAHSHGNTFDSGDHAFDGLRKVHGLIPAVLAVVLHLQLDYPACPIQSLEFHFRMP